MNFEKTEINELEFNPFRLIGKDWFLLTSGNLSEYNTMTASWGQLGFVWNAPVFTTVVRPNRKTFELIEKNERRDNSALIRENGYDISRSYSWMQQFYLEKMKQI